MLRTRARLIALAIITCSLAGAGISASASASTRAPNTANIPGISGHTITVGGLITETIGGIPNYGGAEENIGVEARLFLQNKEGGVDGYKIKYLGATDDGAVTSAAVGIESKLVGRVFAFLPFFSEAGTDDTFLADNHITAWGSPILFCDYAWAFSVGACANAPVWKEVTGFSAVAEILDGHVVNPATGRIRIPRSDSLGLVQAFGPVDEVQTTIDVGASKLTGTPICSYPVIPAGVTDYSPYAAEMMRQCGNGKGPTAILNHITTNNSEAAGFAAAMRALGWKGTMVFEWYEPSNLKSPLIQSEVNGDYTYQDEVGLPQNGAPEFTVLRNTLTEMGLKSQIANIDTGMVSGWSAADMFIDGLKYATPANWGPAKFDKVMQHLQYPGIFNFTPPVSYPRNFGVPDPCFSIDKIVGGSYKFAYPLACGQAADLANGALYHYVFPLNGVPGS